MKVKIPNKRVTKTILVVRDAVSALNADYGILAYITNDKEVGNYYQFKLTLAAKRHKDDNVLRLRRDTVYDPFGSPYSKSHYITSLCYHGFTEFMKRIYEMAPNAIIVTAMSRFDSSADFEDRRYDIGCRNIGSMMYPIEYADSCDCEG